jgi:hypothetical protein
LCKSLAPENPCRSSDWANLYNLERPQPEQTGGFFPCLELFLPAVLGEIHPEWRAESFDGFLPILARKIGQREAEIFGPCTMISDQTWTPFHLKIQIATSNEEVSWVELKVGESGKGGMKRSSLSSVYNRFYLCDQNPQQIDWAYEVSFGNRDSLSFSDRAS